MINVPMTKTTTAAIMTMMETTTAIMKMTTTTTVIMTTTTGILMTSATTTIATATARMCVPTVQLRSTHISPIEICHFDQFPNQIKSNLSARSELVGRLH